MVDLKDYICSVPFNALEIHDNSAFMCCASWLTKSLPKNSAIKDLWKSNEAKEIRKSVTDGSYRFCDKKQCPYLAELLSINKTHIGPIKHISQISEHIEKYLGSGEESFIIGPQTFQMSFDRTCNFMCPTCRNEMIVADTKKIKKVNETIKEFEDAYSESIELIYCSGTADPFASVSYRNYLRNFEPKKYPKLESIHLHTNASLWNEIMWESMPNIHKYVKTCEISIDAGTKYTYENVTRLGGNWDVLIENLNFIYSIPSLKKIKVSFVVQQSNYKEMETFLHLMKSILKEKCRVFYGKVTNWGTFTPEQFEKIKIWDPLHPDHIDFIKEFNKISLDPFVFHNLHEFVQKDNTKLL